MVTAQTGVSSHQEEGSLSLNVIEILQTALFATEAIPWLKIKYLTHACADIDTFGKIGCKITYIFLYLI
jgi:hypothetical protein